MLCRASEFDAHSHADYTPGHCRVIAESVETTPQRRRKQHTRGCPSSFSVHRAPANKATVLSIHKVILRAPLESNSKPTSTEANEVTAPSYRLGSFLIYIVLNPDYSRLSSGDQKIAAKLIKKCFWAPAL